MNKRQEEFLDHFARLGVFSKVQALMGSNGDSDSDTVIRSLEEPTTSRAVKGKLFLNFIIYKKIFLLNLILIFLDSATPGTSAEGQEDAKEILPGKGKLKIIQNNQKNHSLFISMSFN
jgi:E3 ubiquitin-protein ligase HECTD1